MSSIIYISVAQYCVQVCCKSIQQVPCFRSPNIYPPEVVESFFLPGLAARQFRSSLALCGYVDRVKGGVFPNQKCKEKQLQWGMLRNI